MQYVTNCIHYEQDAVEGGLQVCAEEGRGGSELEGQTRKPHDPRSAIFPRIYSCYKQESGNLRLVVHATYYDKYVSPALYNFFLCEI